MALYLIVGHEKYRDRGRSTPSELQNSQLQYNTVALGDLELFMLAINADRPGSYRERDYLLIEILGFGDRPPPGRYGNSLQDFRLSLKGWRFGVMIKNGQIRTTRQAAQWPENNLRR